MSRPHGWGGSLGPACGSPIRMVLSAVRHRAMRRGELAAPTLIVGADEIGALLSKRLINDPSYGLRPVGFLDADPPPNLGHLTAPSVPVLGGPDDLAEAIQSTGARRRILAVSSERDHVQVTKASSARSSASTSR